MNTIEKKLSTSKLSSSKEYREAFVSAFLKRYIPFQIHTIRNKKNMSQKQLADAAKVTQGVISRAEDPDYGNLTFNTVLRIAAGFDLAFVGKFVRFSELVKLADGMTEKSLELPSFVEECDGELKREALDAARREAATAEDNEFLPHIPDREVYGLQSLNSRIFEGTETPYYELRGANYGLTDMIAKLGFSTLSEASRTTTPSPSGATDARKQGLYLVPKPPAMEVSAQSSPQVA